MVKLLLGALSLCIAGALLKPAGSESLIDKNSYEVHTVVRHFDSVERAERKSNADPLGGYRRLDVRLEEKYSHQQARGLVNLRFEGLKDWFNDSDTYKKTIHYEAATFFASPRDKSTLVMNDGTGRCRPTDNDELLKLLELDFMPIELGSELDHVIGPARWVHYMANHRQKLKLDMESGHVTVREVPSIRYTTKMIDSKGNAIDVRVFYEELALAENQQLDALPHRIVFLYGSRSTFIDMYHIKFSSLTGDSLGHIPHSSDEPELDEFTLMPVSGCSQFLSSAESRKPLPELHASAAAGKRQFSFKAHVMQVPRRTHNKDLDFVVAYDDRKRLMRVDMEAPEYSIGRSMALFNYFRNHLYHVLKNPKYDTDFLVNHVLNLDARGQDDNRTKEEENSQRVEDARRMQARCTGGLLSYMDTMMKFTPSRLLLGADEFVYLGRARVRGIRAKVYEAIDTELPHWLEPPVDYNDPSKNDMMTRLASNKNSPLAGDIERDSKSITLVYVSDEKADCESDRILRMEFYKTDAYYKLVSDRRIIQFSDFSWSLNSFDEQASSYEADLFSLASYCGDEATQAGHVELLLEQAKSSNQYEPIAAKSQELLSLPRPRNQATLTALQQDLSVPIEMISELETLLIALPKGPSNRSDEHAWQMLVNFNMVKRQDNKVSAMLVSTGHRVLGRSWYFNLPGFFHCFMLAAHRKVELLFGWDPKRNDCYLSTVSIDQEIRDGLPSFEVSSNKQLEIYRTRNHNEQYSPPEFYNNEYRRHQLSATILSLDLATQLAPEGQQEASPVRMQIKRLKTRGFERRRSSGAQQLDVIQGWGLSAQEKLDIKPSRQPVGSFNECHSLCFNDLNCRAFSFCIHAGATAECLISRTPCAWSVFSERLLASKSKQLELDIDGGRLKLRRSPTCSIHNHRYASHFEPRPGAVHQLRRPLPAGGIEDCARLCISKNLKGVGAHQNHLSEAFDELKAVAGSAISPARLEAVGKIVNSSRLMLASTCWAFQFIEKRLVDSLSDEDHAALVKLAGPSESGYCDLQAVDHEQTVESPLAFNPPISIDSYEMRFSDLYEEQHGVSLLASELTEDERRAYGYASLAMKRWLPNTMVERTELLLGLIERGANLQEYEMAHPIRGDREWCAEVCFKQASGLWPACKSFDLVTVREFGSLRIKCVFNSITRQEAIASNRLELIDTSARDYDRWHYEPKVRVQDSLELLEEANNLLQIFSRFTSGSKFFSFWFQLSVLLIAAMGIVSGLIFSVSARAHLQKHRELGRRLSQGSVAPVMESDLEMNESSK